MMPCLATRFMDIRRCRYGDIQAPSSFLWLLAAVRLMVKLRCTRTSERRETFMSEVSVSAPHSGAACYTGGATGGLLQGLPLSIGVCALTDMPRSGSFPCPFVFQLMKGIIGKNGRDSFYPPACDRDGGFPFFKLVGKMGCPVPV